MKQSISQARILIVDDDPVSRLIMTEVLKPEGYAVATLSSGLNLLDTLSSAPPDVLLLDVMMPDVDGLTLCRQLKEDPRWQHLPIVLVTSLNSPQELVTGLDAGADEFISKPVNGPELRARVRSMIRVKQRSDLLQRVAELRSDLAHMIVHDLRTPLASCLLRTDIMLRTVVRAEVDLSPLQSRSGVTLQESLATVKEQLESLSGQVDDILLLARTDQDELVLQREPADLGAIARDVIAEQSELAARAQVDLLLEMPQSSLIQPLDVNLVTRLVGNLVSNAVKFSPPQSKVIVRLSTSDAGSTTLAVLDEGPGVPSGERQRIFDRYALAAAQKKHPGGFGLGLAFCKMVAEAHGGSIRVSDNQPHGAVFTVTLP